MGDNCNGKADEKKAQREARAEAHIQDIVKEQQNLSSEAYPVAYRLLDEELKRTQETGKASFDNRYIDVYNDKPIKVTSRVMFPTKEFPTFNFVGKVLGPKGNTLKHLQETSRCRMFILGKGSMRDKKKEDELRSSGDPKYAHLAGDLHIEVSCVAPPTEAHSRMACALRELRAVLVPDPPGMGMGMEDGFIDDMPVMPSRHALVPPAASKAKVMGLLEKARQSMEYQPPPYGRYGRSWEEYPHPRGPGEGGRGGWASGPRGGGFFPPRTTPYARP